MAADGELVHVRNQFPCPRYYVDDDNFSDMLRLYLMFNISLVDQLSGGPEVFLHHFVFWLAYYCRHSLSPMNLHWTLRLLPLDGSVYFITQLIVVYVTTAVWKPIVNGFSATIIYIESPAEYITALSKI